MSKISVDIYYEDTDMGGVVYYANYLKYFERARTHHFREIGVDPAEWVTKGITFVVTHAEADYKRPAVYGDTLIVETKLTPVRSARLTFDYVITRKSDGELLVTGKTDMACLNGSMRPCRIPDEIKELIERDDK